MNPITPAVFGETIRRRRQEIKLTQAEAAGLCGVGVRFLSELENGKDTAQLGLTLKVLQGLGLEVNLVPRSWKR